METEEGLPPGFRFFPTEEELVTYYLPNKIRPRREGLSCLIDRVIPVVDIYEFNPWDLPQLSGELCREDPEQWFFFIPRQDSTARGGRPRRLTTTGYWKATGSPGRVYSLGNNRIVGLKRTMVFYNGRAPTGVKTEWKMNEYKAVDAETNPSSNPSDLQSSQEFSLCRIYKKSKCLREFDRRPQLVQMTNPAAALDGGEQHPTPALDGGEQLITMASEFQVTAGVAYYSSSGDDRQDNNRSDQAGESSGASMEDSLMNWEQLDYLFY